MTNDRVATILSAWTAPWRPYSKYFKFNYKRNRITFLMQQMWQDEKNGLTNYWRAASKMANRIGLTIHEGRLPPSQIIEELGEPSQMILIAEAAMAKDPWLLGWIDEPNPKLAAILNIPTDMGIVSLARPEPEPLVEQHVKVEAINLAPPNVDILQMLAEMTKAMTAMQTQVNALSVKKQNVAKKMEKARAAKRSNHTPTPAEAQPA